MKSIKERNKEFIAQLKAGATIDEARKPLGISFRLAVQLMEQHTEVMQAWRFKEEQ